MRKIIKLTELNLQDVVNRVITERIQLEVNEQSQPTTTTYGKCTNSNTINEPRIRAKIKYNSNGDPRKVNFTFTTYFGATKSTEAYKSTLLQLKKQIFEELKSKKVIGNYDLKLMSVETVVGSASNYLNGPLKPTNTQKGAEISSNELDDVPYKSLPGEENSNWVTNKGYADSRWKNLLKFIKNSGKNLGFGVSEDLKTPSNIISRITDTGGCTDEKRDVNEFRNPGQYVRVIGTMVLIPKQLDDTDIEVLTECAQGLTIVVGYFRQPTEVQEMTMPKNSRGHKCDYATFTVSCNNIPVGISNMNNGKYYNRRIPEFTKGISQPNVKRKGPEGQGDTVYSVITVRKAELEKIIKGSKNGKVYMSIKGTPNTGLRPRDNRRPGGTLHGDAPMVWAYVQDAKTGEKRTVYGPKEPFGGLGDVSTDKVSSIGSFNPCIEVTI